MYFKARRSTRIKTGRPKGKQSKGPITVEDTPSKQKTSITYERGSPKTSTWKEMMEKLNSEASLEDVEAALQETLARLKETEKMEEKAAKSS